MLFSPHSIHQHRTELTDRLGVRHQLGTCQSDQRLESREFKLGSRFAFHHLELQETLVNSCHEAGREKAVCSPDFDYMAPVPSDVVASGLKLPS